MQSKLQGGLIFFLNFKLIENNNIWKKVKICTFLKNYLNLKVTLIQIWKSPYVFVFI